MILSVQNIVKSFAGESVLAGISFKVSKGELVALVGPSGAGKTTILNIAVGILQPDSGSVQITNGETSRLGYVLQEPALLPWRTLRENAYLALELVDNSRSSALIDALFQEFELDGAEAKYPAQCSLGMQQRASLIRTLAIEPEVLLLDEPFSSLDYDIKLRVQTNMTRYIDEKGPAVLLVTHDIEDAIALADRVIVMSAKPATMKAEIDINLGLSKRDPIAARTSPRFGEYFERIWQHLKYLPAT
jgi:NitT/TauT family transport system ATP-binding protein